MNQPQCATCHTPFVKTGRRLYCSVECRREMEYRRRHWEGIQRKIRSCESTAKLYIGKPAYENWMKQAEHLKTRFDQRP